MKKTQNEMVDDVQDLLKTSVIEEAVSKVKQQFETAWSSLDPETQELLGHYFDGVTVKELSQRQGVSEEQLASWIARKKRDLVQAIRNASQVRQ